MTVNFQDQGAIHMTSRKCGLLDKTWDSAPDPGLKPPLAKSR